METRGVRTVKYAYFRDLVKTGEGRREGGQASECTHVCEST